LEQKLALVRKSLSTPSFSLLFYYNYHCVNKCNIWGSVAHFIFLSIHSYIYSICLHINVYSSFSLQLYVAMSVSPWVKRNKQQRGEEKLIESVCKESCNELITSLELTCQLIATKIMETVQSNFSCLLNPSFLLIAD
jgi:hypothetical protein